MAFAKFLSKIFSVPKEIFRGIYHGCVFQSISIPGGGALERSAASSQLKKESTENKMVDPFQSGDHNILEPRLTSLGRGAALIRLIKIALSDPLLTLKMINFRFLKNFLQFLISNGIDGNQIIQKYKVIYSTTHQKSSLLIRITTMTRLMVIAMSDPRLTIKLLNPTLFKKSLRFLIKNEGDSSRILNNYKSIFRNTNTKSIVVTHAVAKRFASQYGLFVCRGGTQTATVSKQQLSKWINDLQHLADSLPAAPPTISIIIPVYNQICFTLACIHSILLHAERSDFEIIIADDQSTDETQIVFSQNIRKVKYHRNITNLGFLNNCNQAADLAKGRFLVFLNNDAIVLPGWMDELIRPLEKNPDIGLVGSKLIYPDSRLQEAGGIIFSDANGWNYGRFDNPNKPEYNYLRDVDYCSGASIAISSDLWRSLGGFDPSFSPAYYEDTDLAFQVRVSGKRVVYNPLSEVIHFEGISHGTDENECGKHNQPINQLKFLSKWQDILSPFGPCDPSALPADRQCRGRILVVDAVTPTPDKDSGSVDTYNFLKIFKELGYHVTFIPENLQYCMEYTHALRRLGVECVHVPWYASIEKAVERYAASADFVFLYRAYIADPLYPIVRKHGPHAKIIFDTVDLHFLRKKREAEIYKSQKKLLFAQYMRNLELGLIKKVDATIILNSFEIELINELIPAAKLFHIPVVRDIPGSSGVPWENRQNIAFIGGYNHPPNIDAVIFFVNEVWPHLKAGGFPGNFIIAGSEMPDEISALATDDIIVRGYVRDLSDLFNACRFSVAPLRYGAGMKGKVISSLSYGVPCIGTSVAFEGTGLIPGVHVLVEDDPQKMAALILYAYGNQSLWEKLSVAGLNYCIENCSFNVVRDKISSMLTDLNYSNCLAT
jgi:O-antigen biosynthesis protein